jgi:hypothetical protein
MHFSVYSPSNKQLTPREAARLAQASAEGFDYVTPDGVVVPRAVGEKALLGRTAVLVGGLLVGIWPKNA